MNFKKDVVEKSITRPVVVQFTADWCGPCRMMKPIMKQVNKDRNDFDLVFVDVDSNKDVSRMVGIRSVPTIMMFKDGQALSLYKLGPSPSRINSWLDHFLVEAVD